ncbi:MULTISPECIES: DEAD/DEAH box helicase family protein [unclassified Brevibacterium]|uniref:DEAD/DEAH box helicase family protein n=1 Tax=unclassified Brevibacterium TaxID=2614124 RepID=UPI0014369672|nr:DEAD/DEAH box helicase family protein [Brevibacterium sp. S111]
MTVPVSPLRRHQREALATLDEASAADDRRSWIVLPPGAGKTRVGIEHAVRLLEQDRVGTVVAFGPNTAIQTQWAHAWNSLGEGRGAEGRGADDQGQAAGGPAGTDRELDAVFTALTYQSLAVFDEERESTGSLLDELAPGGRQLVDRLVDSGPLLLILDECHHLLEVWGSLLAELLDLLPEVWVLGLTATPPGTMTHSQRELVSVLFGRVRYSASIPAVVREGDLAPFADLVWLTEPTREEKDWLASEAVHYTEFITGVLDPSRGSLSFLEWVDRRFLGTRAETVSWQSMRASVPDLCDAALRLHHAELLRLPPGARVGEQHRRDPDIDDWALLIDDWMRHHLLASAEPGDGAAAEAIRRALPAIGYRWTRHGIRPGRSPVDRVIARSAAKPTASADIVALEAAELGERLRMLILCDVESATATLSAEVGEVLDERSGSALLVLETLIADPRTQALHPVLMTGRTVAGPPEVLADLHSRIAERDRTLASKLSISEPAAGISRLEGGWTSRTWVPLITECFSRGDLQVLIGTRALLGEGWDAPAVTGVIDLSTATTPTAVTQTRGRALRKDTHWPGKVALNWTVVCVSSEHPRGDQDWGRLVRKHEGFFGTDADGEVVDGVAHIDPAFSAFEPPGDDSFAAINARMTARAQARTEVARRWDVGADYRDEELRSVRILATAENTALLAPIAEHRPAAADTAAAGLSVTRRHLGGDPGRLLPFGFGRGAMSAWIGIGVFLGIVALLSSGVLAAVLGAFAAVVLIGLPVTLSIAGARRRRLYSRPPTVSQVAGAIAEALHEVGLSTQGAEAVRVRIDARGDLRCHLDADARSAEAFALALDEVVSPITDPRYLLPRWHLPPGNPGIRGWWDQLRAGIGSAHERDPVWHAVPSVLGTNRELADAFAASWGSWIGGGGAVYTRNTDGAGILVSVRSANPLELTSVLRTTWH